MQLILYLSSISCDKFVDGICAFPYISNSLKFIRNRPNRKDSCDMATAAVVFYFRKTYISKLGLQQIQDGDDALVKDLLAMMQTTSADLTGTFRQLAEVNINDT